MCSIGVAVLLLFFCVRIWNLGPTHTDDASWRIAANEGNWGVVTSWAVNQGRFFALVSGSLLYIGLYFQGSHFGSLLHVGAFVIFFIAFHVMLRTYTNSRLALLAAALNLGLFALRWEGSVVTTYPLFSWTLATVFVASVYLGWRSTRENNRWLRPASYVLLFISLNIHEGVTLLFGCLAILAVIANYGCGSAEWRRVGEFVRDRAFMRHFCGTCSVVGLYLACYLGWRLYFPSSYQGNQLGSLNPLDFSRVLLSFSISGSVPSDLLWPYVVSFSDAVSQDGFGVIYKPLRYLVSQSRNETAILSGIILLAVSGSLALSVHSSEMTSEWRLKSSHLLVCILIGVAIAVLPVLPVALVGKYQDHFANLNVRSYAFTPLCHFGWAILLATAICYLERINPPTLRRGVISCTVLCLGLLGYCATLKNDAIAADMRQETCRWKAVDHLASILPTLKTPITSVHVPRLKSGSWFTVVPESYWANYMNVTHGQELSFGSHTISRESLAEGVAYVDYSVAIDDFQTVVFAAALGEDEASNQVIAHEIAMSLEGADPSERAQYVLSYRDLEHGFVSRRLSSVPMGKTAGNIRHVENIRAIPSSIQIRRWSDVSALNIECGEYVTPDSTIRFGLASEGQTGGDLGLKWLDDSWHPAERVGIWSNAKSACVSLPVPVDQSSFLKLTIVASTYTGLGFAESPQHVTIQINDRIVANKTFESGDSFQPITCIASPSDWEGNGLIRLSFTMSAVINPAEQGISTDSRDLGLFLKRIAVTNFDGASILEAKGSRPAIR